MKKEYTEAFAEINEILKIMPESLVNKISIKFRQMIQNELDTEYKTNIKEPIENCELKEETKVILGLIYRDFLCEPEERKKLQEKDARELAKAKQELEAKLNEKYNSSDLFKNRKETKKENDEQEEKSLIVVSEEKWYKKLFNIIKAFFGEG